MKRLGERIRRKRESFNLHLGDLAKKVGISSSALSQIESAKAFTSILNFKAIADSLNATVGEIIGMYETLSKNPMIKESEKKLLKKIIREHHYTCCLIMIHINKWKLFL